MVQAGNVPFQQLVQPVLRGTKAKLAEFALQNGLDGFKAAELAVHLRISKQSARQQIKYALGAGIIATDGRTNPQRYYHASIIADVKKARYARNVPFDPTGVGACAAPTAAAATATTSTTAMADVPVATSSSSSRSAREEHQRILDAVNFYKLDSILQSLPGSPWYIHNLHYEVQLNDSYSSSLTDFPFQASSGWWQKLRKGKWKLEKLVSGHSVKFVVYPSACKAMVYSELSRTPLKMATWEDYDYYNQWLGAVCQELRNSLADSRCLIVPPAQNWEKIRSDINCDVPAPHELHLMGPNLQVKYDNYVMRIYIKSLGDQTVLRVEKSEWQRQRPLEHAAEVLTLNGLERRLTRLENREAERDARLDTLAQQVASIERRLPRRD